MRRFDRRAVQRDWGHRNTTIRDKVAETLRGRPALLEHTAVIVQALPVPPQAAEEKETLVRELREASGQWGVLLQRVGMLSDRVKLLSVVDGLSKGRVDEGTSGKGEDPLRVFTRLHEALQARLAKERRQRGEEP